MQPGCFGRHLPFPSRRRRFMPLRRKEGRQEMRRHFWKRNGQRPACSFRRHGNGRAGGEESRIAIELLEQFTEAGFDRALAVRMINSALLRCRGEEAYATLDICHVNLFDGHAEFIKLGAVASFIWRRDRIISLRAVTLPAGILKQVEPEKNEMRIKDGDMILMVTDGITDASAARSRRAHGSRRS